MIILSFHDQHGYHHLCTQFVVTFVSLDIDNIRKYYLTISFSLFDYFIYSYENKLRYI